VALADRQALELGLARDLAADQLQVADHGVLVSRHQYAP